jgi:hypothetical protein
MKGIWIASIMLLASTQCLAMEKIYHDLLKTEVGEKKSAVIKKVMDLSEADAAIFDEIYKEYDKELERLNTSRGVLIQEYLAIYETMSQEMAEVMTQQFLEMEEKELEIKQKCLKKMEEKLSFRTAADFYHLDTKLNLMIHLQVSSKLPLTHRR